MTINSKFLFIIFIFSNMMSATGDTNFGKLFRLSETEKSSLKDQTVWVLDLIQSKHYLKNEIKHIGGDEIIENFLNHLDYSKLYFCAKDVKGYHFRFSSNIESFLERGNLYPAFTIYQDFAEKFRKRTEWAISRLDRPFNFNNDDLFESDRSEADWMEDEENINSTWEKYLKYQVLNELLSSTIEATEESSEENSSLSLLKKVLDDSDFYSIKYNDAIDKLKRRYKRNLNFIKNKEVSDIQEMFINSITQVFDPHSSFLSSHTLENFNSHVNNSFVGIGAHLEDIDGICTVRDILPGGPAEKSNQLKAKDEIIGVAQGDAEFEDVIDMSLTYIVRKIKGPKNTIVRLLVRPGDTADPSARKIVSLKRDEVKLTANLASAKAYTIPAREDYVSIGVISLPSFYGSIGYGSAIGNTTDDVKELIEKLKLYHNIDGLILDLRNNGGGLLSEAVRLSGLFIPVGPIVQVVDARGKKQVLHDQSPEISWEGPLVVLTSKFSASASEIVAGALQDHERALIIGDSSTHGKGTVQEVYHMNNRFSFKWFQASPPKMPSVASKITIKQFFLPKGSSTQLKGVSSDITLPSINEILPISESDLENPIAWKEIDAVQWYNNWKTINVSSPYQESLISYLKESSAERHNILDELLYLQDDIDWRTKSYEETLVSLNLSTRIEEKILEQEYNDLLEERYDALKEFPYPQADVILDIREKQEEKSKNLINSFNEINSSSTDELEQHTTSDSDAEELPFDIHLRESSRIIRDWIIWENDQSEKSF